MMKITKKGYFIAIKEGVHDSDYLTFRKIKNKNTKKNCHSCQIENHKKKHFTLISHILM